MSQPRTNTCPNCGGTNLLRNDKKTVLPALTETEAGPGINLNQGFPTRIFWCQDCGNMQLFRDAD